jgi:hypothetical protein
MTRPRPFVGALQRVVVNHDELAVHAVDVEFDRVDADLQCARERSQRVLGFETCGAAMADDQKRDGGSHVGDSARDGHLQ